MVIPTDDAVTSRNNTMSGLARNSSASSLGTKPIFLQHEPGQEDLFWPTSASAAWPLPLALPSPVAALGNPHIQTTMARAPPPLSLQSMTPLTVLGGFLCLQLRDDDPLGAGGGWYLMMVMSSGKEGRWFSS